MYLVSSNAVYQLYHTYSLDDITHTLCMTSYSVCVTLHELFMTSQSYMYDITPSVIMTPYPIYVVLPILLSWQHNYTWHLTHNIWHHHHSICVITCTLSMKSQQERKSSHLSYGCHPTQSIWHNIHSLWHQCSVFMTKQPLHSWHQISFIWHHNHGVWHLIPYSCDITATISVSSNTLDLGIHIQYIWHQTHCDETIQPLYLTSHTPYLYLCGHTQWINDITHTVCRASHGLYVWHNMHYILNHTHTLWHHNAVSVWSHRLYGWYDTHCM